MKRDLLGQKVKKKYIAEMLDLFEKYYLYKNKIFQVIRINRYVNKEGFFYEIKFRNLQGKIYSKRISEKTFKERAFFGSIKGLNKYHNIKRAK